MKAKSVVFFILALAISLLAASYRWGDSTHTMGQIKASGGKARHPAFLSSGESGYNLIATATVIPPYRGDARIVLEGKPYIDHRLYLSGPIVDLGISRNPKLTGNIIRGLHPGDRIVLWLLMKPHAIDPVCGMGYAEGFRKIFYAGKNYFFCSETCAKAFNEDPARYKDTFHTKGRYNLSFYDTNTNRPVLRIPVIFKGTGGTSNAGEHQH